MQAWQHTANEQASKNEGGLPLAERTYGGQAKILRGLPEEAVCPTKSLQETTPVGIRTGSGGGPDGPIRFGVRLPTGPRSPLYPRLDCGDASIGVEHESHRARCIHWDRGDGVDRRHAPVRA